MKWIVNSPMLWGAILGSLIIHSFSILTMEQNLDRSTFTNISLLLITAISFWIIVAINERKSSIRQKEERDYLEAQLDTSRIYKNLALELLDPHQRNDIERLVERTNAYKEALSKESAKRPKLRPDS